MNPRISTSMMYQQSIANIMSKQARLEHLGRQVSSRERLVTAKDDPVDAASIIGLGRNLAALNQYGKNANFVQSRLGLQENALESAGNAMARARDLTIQAGNAILTPENRKAIVVELEKLKDTVLDLANATDGNGRYLFAGTRDAEAAFVKTGATITYQGDDIQRETEIAPSTLVKDALPGSAVFFNIGPEQKDVFSVLDHLTSALDNSAISTEDLNAVLSASLRDVSLAGDQFVNARTAIGVQLKKIDTTADLRAANEVTLETQLSAIRDINDAQVIGELNLEKIALEAAQTVFMKMQGMSLFERMR